MRVLLVPSLALEGWKAMDRYGVSLLRHLPDVLPAGWSVKRLEDPGYPRWSRFLARWVLYPRTVKWDAYDVVHVLDHSYAHILHGRSRRVRTVLTVHDLYALEKRGHRRGLRRAAVRGIDRWVLDGILDADVCLCDSEATLLALGNWNPEAGSRGRMERLGVDESFFVADLDRARAEGREWLGAPPGSLVVLHVGSCVPRKNIGSVLTAFSRLHKKEPSAVLVQAGGVFRKEQRREVDCLGIKRAVIQRSSIPEEMMPKVYAAADIVVLPSLFEGFGFPVLEGFAVGVPVSASRNWSLADFPEELLESAGRGSSEELLGAMERVFENRDASRERAARARIWARQWTWKRVALGAARAYGALG